jgi:hypothetical protein
MKDSLDVAEALGLMQPAEKERLLGDLKDFGRTMLCVETSYDDSLVTNLFLIDGKPRSKNEFENIGRKALLILVQQDDADSFRRKPATDDGLWEEMRTAGQFNFRFIEKLKSLNAAQLGAVSTDYVVIAWWAEAMEDMSEQIAKLRRFLDENPGIDPENNNFKSLRRELAQRLRDVAKNTREEFGDPWGLVAMDLLSGRKALARVQVTGSIVSFQYERDAG